MPAPIWLGSSRAESMFTRPIRVPIMPKAGAKVPPAARTLAPSAWRLSICSRSVSRIFSSSWGSVPSTARRRPLRRKASGSFSESSSRASMPSRRARSAYLTSLPITTSGSSTEKRKAFLRTPATPMTRCRGKFTSMAPRVPPSTTATEGMSMKPLRSPPSRMDQTIRPNAKTRPTTVAMSTPWSPSPPSGRVSPRTPNRCPRSGSGRCAPCCGRKPPWSPRRPGPPAP